MDINSPNFIARSKSALDDAGLQKALANLKAGFPGKRKKAMARMPEFDAMRDQAVEIKNKVIENLDYYLETFQTKVEANGGQVHWASTSEDACQTILDICRSVDAKTVTKGKSMVTEEINLNAFLEQHSVTPVETDLGEYILQLRGDHPSHIIAPAIHLNLPQVSDIFEEKHQLPRKEDPAELMQEARDIMRDHFVAADVGITGANFFVAETGSTMIVTNEGNGDLTQTLPKVHIVVTSIEKCVPTLEDLSLYMRLLSRSATGQESAVYNTLSSGPKQAGDQDGPEQFHVVLVDNGRSSMVGDKQQDMLRCIRCSACMNHCPVYSQIGGHAYGWVYPGPMGSVLTPKMIGIEQAGHLPNASTFCGKCEAVCPVRIPLPSLMRTWRERQFDQGQGAAANRYGIQIWAALARRPWLYHAMTRIAMPMMKLWSGQKNRISSLPLARGWTLWRDLPAPEGKTFMQQWNQRNKEQQP
ncbi:MAG: iron-sulfur cluster-binding protein [Oceanospirillaceae bacterium]|jgi:L-lactate dehydrogenase complex protein LldF|nr:iron-sulfur cluster-binding protein [Oceanospirillaceae bacterium]MBT6077022.1 iron-sulfur cluster-binding protein [Oceanospirillaceae bacterium]